MGSNIIAPRLHYIGAGSNILEPLLVKNMFFVLFSNMNHGELKVPSPFGRPSSDTQNLVLSELSLFIPPQNIENKILGLQSIGAGLQFIGAPKCSWLIIVFRGAVEKTSLSAVDAVELARAYQPKTGD